MITIFPAPAHPKRAGAFACGAGNGIHIGAGTIRPQNQDERMSSYETRMTMGAKCWQPPSSLFAPEDSLSQREVEQDVLVKARHVFGKAIKGLVGA